MNKIKKFKQIITLLIVSTTTLGGCTIPYKAEACTSLGNNVETRALDFTYEVNPKTFEITVEREGQKEKVSLPSVERKVSQVKKEKNKISWSYPDEEIKIKVTKEKDYLEVKLESTKEGENIFEWPKVAGPSYMLPLREGKYIPSGDTYWKEYLHNMEMNMLESLSMRFFAVNHENYSVLYVMEDLFGSQMNFNTEGQIAFNVQHTYVSINPEKAYSFRIYVTPTSPVDVAKTYKQYIVEKGEFESLEKKAKENPNIKKLYGASHMYLWDTSVIDEEDIHWQAFRKSVQNPVMKRIQSLYLEHTEEPEALEEVLKAIKRQDYVDDYQKGVICKALTQVLMLPEFYNEKVFKVQGPKIEKLLKKGIQHLNEAECIELNKRVLQVNMPGVFAPVEEWANDRTVDLLKEMKAGGMNRLWIGLDQWTQGFSKPELVQYAADTGYLIGPYDSYHSIHEPGKEQWHTATFKDITLYEEATVINKKGEYEEGFQGVGRKLNPTLSLPSVKERMDSIMAVDLPFNTWFVDCDATGEIYDDYAPNHVTTAKEDLQARLSRMGFIRDEYDMVIGSEGGNDFASNTIAIGHGIELPSFSWMDEDMRKNKDSEYYLGKYYNGKGGAPEKFTKQVPLKAYYKKIFLDQVYNLPLFKLVYNDSVITTYHWDWSTFKIKDEVSNRMLYEILYNVPPLYHIDRVEWEKHKEDILMHSKIYEAFSKKAVQQEMTDFKILSEDRLVQMTQYGSKLKVVVNFSPKTFNYEGDKIAPNALIIYDSGEKIYYQK